MNDKLNDLQHEMLIGLLLGDGCLMKRTENSSPLLSIARAEKDLNYLNYHLKIFQEFCKCSVPTTRSIYDKRTDKTYVECRFRTRHCKALINYYNEWYGGQRKHLPAELTLTPIICAVWFCDDGCIIRRNKRLALSLATNSFTQEENIRLALMLKEMFQEQFNVYAAKNNQYIIGAADAATKKFIKYIEPYLSIFFMDRKRIWDDADFDLPKSRSRLRNRRVDDLGAKELHILSLLNDDTALTIRQIAIQMNWINIKTMKPYPQLYKYIKRFLKFGFIEKKLIRKRETRAAAKKSEYSITMLGIEALMRCLNEAHNI